MNNLDKLVERLYSETDFARSIATSVAGIVGLVIYLVQRDWVIAAFSAVIVFPVVRLASARIHERRQRAEKRRMNREDAAENYSRLSEHEQAVVQAFVEAGGAVLTWSQVNALELRGPAIESLIHRELLGTSMTADGMRETFVLDPGLFEAGVARARSAPSNSSSKPTPLRGAA
ncbi:hypothetical protein [Sorangium sp. So ce362]|uniref:hypothetical protein n=1 Tax=Sorangium sp. So ce362 TaxID=3133303 RepID=UPI003F606F9B